MSFCMLCMIAFCQSGLLKRDDDVDDEYLLVWEWWQPGALLARLADRRWNPEAFHVRLTLFQILHLASVRGAPFVGPSQPGGLGAAAEELSLLAGAAAAARASDAAVGPPSTRSRVAPTTWWRRLVVVVDVELLVVVMSSCRRRAGIALRWWRDAVVIILLSLRSRHHADVTRRPPAWHGYSGGGRAVLWKRRAHGGSCGRQTR